MIRTIIPDGVAEQQIRRAFQNINYGFQKISQDGIGIVLDDKTGAALGTGTVAERYIPWDCRITDWTVLAAQSGSIQVDLWALTLASYPPTNANTITGANEIAVSGAWYAQDVTLTSWTPQLYAGYTLLFNIDSCTTIQRAFLWLGLERS